MKQKNVGLLIETSPQLIIALLGIMRSGACMVPLSPIMSVNRLQYIVDDARLDLILTDDKNIALAEKLLPPVRLLNLDKLRWDDIPAAGDAPIQENYYSYIIYTSGSTGEPKGVPITYGNLSPVIFWGVDYLGLSGDTRVFQNLSYIFDFGIFEVLTTMLCGGELHFLPVNDFNAVCKYIDQNNINTVHTTPSFMYYLLSGNRRMDSLEQIHLGGEEVNYALIEKIKEQTNSSIRIHNGYGPTECSINASIYTYDAAKNNDKVNSRIPIGKPSANNRIYILNDELSLVPIGIVGELCIAGPAVSDGYINKPELTSTKFTASPFQPGVRLYRTGDMAKWLPDGNIVFLGRSDSMVKIRGYRIELDEIESSILKLKGIEAAAVVFHSWESDNSEIVAYIISDHEPVLDQLTSSLSKSLPVYMLPTKIIRVDCFPLTPSGKIDKKKLPAPVEASEKITTPFVAPRNELEEKLTSIWKDILLKEKISIKDSFFDLGGHSLAAIKLLTKIKSEFNVNLNLTDMFSAPTIESVAEHIKNGQWMANPLPKSVDAVKTVKI